VSSQDERLERIERKLDLLVAAIVGPAKGARAPKARARAEHPHIPAGEAGREAPIPGVIVCADWSKHPRNRRAWIADPVRRTLSPLGAAGPTVESLVGAAQRCRSSGFALIAFDAPIGVPSSYLVAARPYLGLSDTATFVDWLPAALEQPDFLDPVMAAEDWSPVRPFFRVPKGVGGLTTILKAAQQGYGVQLTRAIDTATGAKSVFAFDIPGQVGPAAQALWQELAYAIDHAQVAIWPFDGDLVNLAHSNEVVVAEIYPRAAYSTALATELPAQPRSLAKTKDEVRRREVENLVLSRWVRDEQVLIEDSALATASEDEFDALMTAAALLRLTLARRPFSTFTVDPVAEGAILAV
jgi:hypothetical protein